MKPKYLLCTFLVQVTANLVSTNPNIAAGILMGSVITIAVFNSSNKSGDNN